ncbi:MAG: ATPase domain-containing protein, partial [Candidatus Aminicenantales bacterium]
MKDKTVFICQSCGARYPKWMGRCSSCGEWNTLVEEVEEEVVTGAGGITYAPSEPVLYKDIQDIPRQRLGVGIEDLNKVLGGGLVSGSLVLIGGEPGIGKSTLMLQVAREMAVDDASVLYVSGEESLEQIKLRGDRLGVREGQLYLLAETNLERILAQAERLAPKIMVVDSIQTVFSAKMSSGPGTISQVREAANQIFRFAKTRQIPTF